MPKGYVILTEAIKDPEGMKAYGKAARSEMSGATVLAVDTAPKVLEGSWHGDQTVVAPGQAGDRLAIDLYLPGGITAQAKNQEAGMRGDCGDPQMFKPGLSPVWPGA